MKYCTSCSGCFELKCINLENLLTSGSSGVIINAQKDLPIYHTSRLPHIRQVQCGRFRPGAGRLLPQEHTGVQRNRNLFSKAERQGQKRIGRNLQRKEDKRTETQRQEPAEKGRQKDRNAEAETCSESKERQREKSRNAYKKKEEHHVQIRTAGRKRKDYV